MVLDSVGARKQTANAYLLQDPRVTQSVVAEGRAGAWTDVNGIANLGSWRAGTYTVRVRLIGFRPEVRKIHLAAGRTDTVRVVMRERMGLQ